MDAELFVGADAEKVVVSTRPLRVRSGLVRRERSGSLVEFVCRPPDGRGLDERITVVSRIALPLIFVSAVLCALGVSWLLAVGGCAGVIAAVWRRQARAAQPAAFAVPREEAVTWKEAGSRKSAESRKSAGSWKSAGPREEAGTRKEAGPWEEAGTREGVGAREEAWVLWTVPERGAFYDALDTARRIRKTWPALGGMIDPVLADRALTGALAELAEVLERRQELRRLRADLAGVQGADIPADSPARRAADIQRDRAEQAWREAGDDANRILRAVDAAARAGESFIRERQVAAVARHAERTLARVTGAGNVAGNGPELADRTEAVIAAYRELDMK
ncbi:hypothetical protein GCM10009828_062890 [Actinoplanes couchii]|uniref:Uncharacterized protein n=1 Tax=Actinoplanes couchii TaxID=403638 RepID=A0ABQ3X3K2_9ACTN|nr:hypothetical protein Aco03nite_014900 [Actinoplanes couchii]